MAAGWRARAVPEDLPRFVPPMLAVAGTMPERDSGYGFEFKWDGVRGIAVLDGGTLRLMSRNDRDITGSYPDLRALGDMVDGRRVVLDGEIVAFDEVGRPSFGVLQQRMHVRTPSRALLAATPVRYFAFDVTHLDGYSTRRLSYQDRRDLLEGLDLVGPGVEVPPYFVGGGAEVLDACREQGLEGVVAKRLDSPYLAGRRSTVWTKVKISLTQDVVVGGWKEGAGRRTGTVGSLLLGLPRRPSGLRFVGHVGTGFTDAVLRDLRDRLRRLARPTSPFSDGVPVEQARGANWVEPSLVGEVTFTEWTRDGVLRHPSWRGLRPDRSLADLR